MINVIPVKYGDQINLRVEEFITSSNGTCCNNFDFDIYKLHEEAELVSKEMDSELVDEFILLRNYHHRNLIAFENSLEK